MKKQQQIYKHDHLTGKRVKTSLTWPKGYATTMIGHGILPAPKLDHTRRGVQNGQKKGGK